MLCFSIRRSPFDASLWKAASYAISTRLSFLREQFLFGEGARLPEGYVPPKVKG